MTRAKFKVERKIEDGNGFNIVLTPVTCGSKENDNFYKWTPCGKIELGIVSKDTADKFHINKTFYVDFTECE